jgi:hypothetical protein
MPLVELNLLVDETAMPGDVRSFLREAERRIERFQLTGRVPGFVPSDFERAYGVLRALTAAESSTAAHTWPIAAAIFLKESAITRMASTNSRADSSGDITVYCRPRSHELHWRRSSNGFALPTARTRPAQSWAAPGAAQRKPGGR